jgi:hypothetical protein
MEDTQHEPRVADRSGEEQAEEIRDQAAPAAIVARLLANPRRVRRN